MDVNQSSILAILFLFVSQVTDALILQAATVTTTCQNIGFLHYPIPHTIPTPLPVGELRIRQAQTALATCGFINGDGDLPVTCGASLYCATTSTYVGCCERTNCLDIFTRCYDLLGSPCDQACQNNPQNLVCPSSLPYCARYNYESGSVGIGCARVSGYTTSVLLTTKSALSTISTTVTSSSHITTITATPGSIPKSSGLSTGAMAGIAVGATLVVVAILLIAWFLWRKNRKLRPPRGNPDNTMPHDAKEVDATAYPDRSSKLSELPSSPRTPLSPGYYAPSQPSPGLPKYSKNPTQYYEMAGEDRPISYATAELGSSHS